MIPRRDFIQMLGVIAMQSQTNTETIKKLAETADLPLTDARAQELAAVYKGIFDDTRALRQLDVRGFPPATVFEAG